MINGTWIADLWATNPGLVTAVTAGLVVVLVVAVAGPLVWLARRGRLDAKLKVGTAIVQAGMTAAVVSGTYEFCAEVFGLPWWEALAFGIFLEAATWVAVGRILEHARPDKHGHQLTGMGYGGFFFWLFSLVGGFLAVIAGDTAGEMVGRAAVMVVGTGLWFLTLLTRTKPGRFARRLLIALGALQADDVDVPSEHREWQIRQLARAIRWANARGPLRWLGRRALTTRSEQATPDVLDEARRRYATTHLMLTTVDPTSEVMAAVLAAVQDDVVPSRRAELDRMRAEIEQTRDQAAAERARLAAETDQARAELEQLRADLALERADIEHARAALTAQRRSQIPTPTKDVPPAGQNPASPAGGDVDLVREVAQWRENARVAGRPYGQRPVADQFGVSRTRAAELITAADAYLAQVREQQEHVNGKQYPIPTAGATP